MNVSSRTVSRRILLAEDSPDDAAFLVQAFATAGASCEVELFEDGCSLWRRIRAAEQEPFDLVLLDYYLPALSAGDILEAARSSPGLARVPVVVMSSLMAGKARARLIDLGVAAILVKPLEPEGWIAMARSLLEIMEQAEN